MMRTLVAVGVVAASLGTGACTQFEASRQVLSPSAPTQVPGGSTTGSLTGLWAAPSDITLNPSTCKNFQWIITSQSESAIAGSFTAECGNGLTISATASGQLTSPTTVALNVTGSGVLGVVGCQFNLNGNGTIQGSESITIVYTGTTCFGPVSGTEVLRRPAPTAPPAPPPTPEQPEPPPYDGSVFHVAAGPLSAERAEEVVEAVGAEFPFLLAPTGSDGAKVAATDELLHRTVWHLQLAGFQAGRQRNPSQALSLDKVTILINGAWRSFDIYTNFDLGHLETRVQFVEVWPANHVPNGGLPD